MQNHQSPIFGLPFYLCGVEWAWFFG